jgi:hypothetical protein
MEIDFFNFDWWLDVLEEEVAKLQEELEERLRGNNCDM